MRRLSPSSLPLVIAVGLGALATAASSCKDESAGGGAPASSASARSATGHAAPGRAAGERPSGETPRTSHLLEADVTNAPLIGAMFMATPIMSDMDWPEKDKDKDKGRRARAKQADGNRVMRLGYVRQGQKVPVFPEAHRKANCAEGWYELVAGGFVCGKYATLDLNHPRVRLAPHEPDLTSALPYVYATNLTNGTPLYFSVPTKEDRVRLEPWLAPKPRPKVEEDTNPYPDPEDTPSATLAKAASVTGLSGDEDAGVPWYLREHDGGKPQVSLDELRGESGGPVVRRMVRGFFFALDSELKVKQVKWWRTTFGHVVAVDRVMVHRPPTDFHGTWLNKADPPVFPPPLRGEGTAPLVFQTGPVTPATLAIAAAGNNAASVAGGGMVLSSTTTAPAAGGPGAVGIDTPLGAPSAAPAFSPLGTMGSDAGAPKMAAAGVGFILSTRGARYSMSADRKYVMRGEPLPYRTALGLTGQSVKIGEQTYDETVGGFWMRAAEGTKTKPGPAPKDLAPGEKWIDVNLQNQTLVAFEGDTPVYATLVSSGKKDDDDKDKDHRTPSGTFRIREKHITATMDGDVASDGPYSIEDVPWVMYFQGSYALHGAFWHGVFGRERSHGCVNLAPADARALFFWADPPLPEHWHGVAATESRPGTRVNVHE